ncbi:HD domain-containing phosphohydrolase [Chromohalobacter moromii]|uniref:PilZ domain-containing protein n=1 Tax=Chromohalobacter moromii TaxID=2860329 RepID=A0A9X2X2R8_9GAMM|nr:HD domain-containing phosphohydrolase [Chromohalobacter moromii]MCK2046342.1 PilZ domain-containing protein [Chromohalobacter moromii]MCT8505847.1 PilZ domain-containing protein [Chromohalobacter moromii]
MLTKNSSTNHPANVLRSLLAKEHAITIFSKKTTKPLSAEVINLDLDTGQFDLSVNYHKSDIDTYIYQEHLSFDIEIASGAQEDKTEIYNFEKVKAKVLKKDTGVYEIKCQLGEELFIQESRGAVRIPFILGMSAYVNIEVFSDELTIKGRLRNISNGGCMIDIALEDSLPLYVTQLLPSITLEFPNGEYFYSQGSIRHMRPFGSEGHAAIGIQFVEVPRDMENILFRLVSESEREAAHRAGMNMRGVGPSPLFFPRKKENTILKSEQQAKADESHNMPPMVKGVREISRQLQAVLIYIKNWNSFPEETLYDCTDSLIHLVRQNRKELLYALSFIRDQPGWIRHAIQVAGYFADMLITRDPHSPYLREVIAGTLLHTMGKPLLMSDQLPSLKTNMTPQQKEILRGHVDKLLEKIAELGWQPSKGCLDIIQNANERLDGSGYPNGKKEAQLSEMVKQLSVIKIINKLTNERNSVSPRTPLDAYRWAHENGDKYERTVIIDYIQQYGLYPIGSLAKFSGGFLAWVMDIDNKGMPNKVHVVKNLAFIDASIDTHLSSNDFSQIGKLEGTANPNDYSISHKP